MDKENVLREIESREYATTDELLKTLDIERADLERILKELEAEREIGWSRDGRVALLKTLGLYKGRLDKKPSGFGFVLMGKDEQDIYVAEENQQGALNGEIVLVRKTEGDGDRPEGIVTEILSELPLEIVGTFHVEDDGVKYVKAAAGSSVCVRIPDGDTDGAENDDRVVCEVTRRNPVPGGMPEGRITEVLGSADTPGIDILVYARKFGLEAEFPEDCIRQAEELARQPVTPEGRLDLRGKTIITIDGADSKDLDDAVSLEVLRNGNYRLGVHIADVSHYVQENTPLDKEALRRGTSVYLVDRVIPMLPQILSNGICSLNPHEDKYTLSCIMEIDPDGNVLSHELANSIISSTERMTYQDVNFILEGDPELSAKYAHIKDMLFFMNTLAKTLRKKRFEEGSIDFDLPEAKIEMDENKRPLSVVVRERGDAEKLIEEFMLRANITVAEQFYDMEMPFCYRIHEPPDAEKVKELSTFLQNLGIRMRGMAGEIHPKTLQNVLNRVEGSPQANIVSSVVLRSLSKARYDTEPIEHFGLAAPQYCHFTSPIRRYPDLEVHRIVKLFLSGQMQESQVAHLETVLPGICDQCSERERNAITAERAVDAMEMAEYMLDHLGDEAEGIISGVTRFGVFVELPNTIEGMIPMSSLTDDYYELNEAQYCLIGEHTRRRLTLGDSLRVVAVNANPELGRVEFAPAAPPEKKTQPSKPKRAKTKADAKKSTQRLKPKDAQGKGKKPERGKVRKSDRKFHRGTDLKAATRTGGPTKKK